MLFAFSNILNVVLNPHFPLIVQLSNFRTETRAGLFHQRINLFD